MIGVTIRTLAILRHAKADNPPGVADIDRPLTPRGHADATAAGAWLTNRGILPELVICSPSRRTRETWHGVAVGLGAAPVVMYERDVYSGDADDLLRLVTEVDDDIPTVVLIGHNPAVSQLSARLDPKRADADGLRTCGLAVHRLDGPWSDWDGGDARLATTHTARAEA
jgi:phosphohistidine phosphatase